MNTLHFKYAVEIERTRSISQAAENLFMAQPNLSKAIKELEDTLGITIFERTSKGVVPTEPGEKFIKYAKRILVQLDKMESIYIPYQEERQSLKLSIARESYISDGFVNFISELDTGKEIDIRIQETNTIQTIANVAENNYNLGIIRYEVIYEKNFMEYLSEKRMSYETIWEFNELLLMSKNHKLAGNDRIDYKQLLETSIEILYGDNIIPYQPVREIKKPLSAEKKFYIPKNIYIYERSSQFDILAHLPETYMWTSPIPEELAGRYGLVQRKCDTANNLFKDLLIYRKGYELSELDKKFLNRLYEAKNEVSFKNYK